MGLFQSKQQPAAPASDDQSRFFDEVFREELRNHGRWYFEKLINENGEVFKEDLKRTIVEVKAELKEHITSQLDTALDELSAELKVHVTSQLDERLAQHSKTLQDTQAQAIQSITASTKDLEAQYQQFSSAMQAKVTEQEATFMTVFKENAEQIVKLKDAQGMALQALSQSTLAIQEQQKALTTTLQENIAKQEEMFVEVFKQNMSQIIEHYLLGALGDQYDLKSQLPAIIKQMESTKQAIVDDMKL